MKTNIYSSKKYDFLKDIIGGPGSSNVLGALLDAEVAFNEIKKCYSKAYLTAAWWS
jgi:hypothetical protein